LEFLKASIADLITVLFSSLQNSEGSGDGDSGDSCADPCQFNGDLEPLKGLGINFFGSYHPLIYLNIS
jgi:hypothetical protein